MCAVVLPRPDAPENSSVPDVVPIRSMIGLA